MFPNILLPVTSTYLWRPKVESDFTVDFYSVFSGTLMTAASSYTDFDYKKNSYLFLHGSSIYLLFYFMKLPSFLWWYITVLQLSEDSSSLAAKAVESTGKDMASGGRWWSLSADYRKIETCTRCLFRWLKVRLMSRHPKWSLCLFCFPGLTKHIHGAGHSQHKPPRVVSLCHEGSDSPTTETQLLVVSFQLGREVCIWCDSRQQKSPAMLQKCVRNNLTPWCPWISWFPVALFQQTADVGWHCSSSGLRTQLSSAPFFP